MGVDKGHGNRSNGITVLPFSNRRSMSVTGNITCTDTYSDIDIYSSTIAVGHAAREAEERKTRKYEALGAYLRFEPVTVEIAGAFGEFTAALISVIGRRIAESMEESTETF